MQTPRPDYFTYPHGAPADKSEKKTWLRAVFVGGLIGAFALGLALALAS
jgi:cytochrome bd-type quinol oxidase subunit 2